MPTPDRWLAPQPDPVLAPLEARIAWLEAAVTQLLAEQERRAPQQAGLHGSIQPGFHLNLVDVSAAGPVPLIPRSSTGLSSRLALATTQPLSRLVPVAGLAGIAPLEPPMPVPQPLSARAADADLRAVATPAYSANAATAMSLALDNMGITAAFASLDAKVEEASAAECMIAPIRLSSAPVLDIDAALIDAATNPATSKRLSVQANIEGQYPSITLKVCSAWRTPELRDDLHCLLADDHGKRGEARPGGAQRIAVATYHT